ncbi:hypothetical protein ACWEO2_42250 [Nocardia sp. NPDC004278]
MEYRGQIETVRSGVLLEEFVALLDGFLDQIQPKIAVQQWAERLGH